jgi:hypothetical protein
LNLIELVMACANAKQGVSTQNISVQCSYSMYSININLRYEPAKPMLARLSSITRPYLKVRKSVS